MNPALLLGGLLPQVRNQDELFEMAALMGEPPSDDVPLGMPPQAPQMQGGLGPALAGVAQQPQPGMKVPPMPGINMPNPGNPSIGAALMGG